MPSSSSTLPDQTVPAVVRETKNENESDHPGKVLYAQYCLACHQANGTGVPNMQPALVGSGLLQGDADVLVTFMLTGDRPVPTPPGTWLGVMAQFDGLTDQDLSDLLSWLRATFVDAPPITAEDIARLRAN